MTTMFAVGRKDLRRTRWLETPPVALRPGEARLRIDLFALTANNVTYGAFGDAMHYWDFFPTGDAETGCIPVWGFATVSESLVDGVDVGERCPRPCAKCRARATKAAHCLGMSP